MKQREKEELIFPITLQTAPICSISTNCYVEPHRPRSVEYIIWEPQPSKTFLMCANPSCNSCYIKTTTTTTKTMTCWWHKLKIHGKTKSVQRVSVEDVAALQPAEKCWRPQKFFRSLDVSDFWLFVQKEWAIFHDCVIGICSSTAARKCICYVTFI